MALVDDKERRLAEMIADMIRKLRQYLSNDVMRLRTVDGKLTTDALNISRLDSMVRTLRSEIEARGFGAVRQYQGQAMQDLAGDMLRLAGEADISEVFSSVNTKAIQMLIDGDDQKLTSAVGSAADQLSEYLRTQILGAGDKARLLSDIMGKLEITERQLQTLISTALHSFNRQVTVMHAQEHGIEEFGFEGPDDSVTREWCEHWVGRRGTPDQFEETVDDWGRDKQPGPVMVWGGGYNCRHRFVVITERNKDRFGEPPV